MDVMGNDSPKWMDHVVSHGKEMAKLGYEPQLSDRAYFLCHSNTDYVWLN